MTMLAIRLHLDTTGGGGGRNAAIRLHLDTTGGGGGGAIICLLDSGGGSMSHVAVTVGVLSEKYKIRPFYLPPYHASAAMLLDAAPNREMARAWSAMRAKKLQPDSDYFQGRPDTFAASKMRGETSF